MLHLLTETCLFSLAVVSPSFEIYMGVDKHESKCSQYSLFFGWGGGGQR